MQAFVTCVLCVSLALTEVNSYCFSISELFGCHLMWLVHSNQTLNTILFHYTCTVNHKISNNKGSVIP